MRPAVFLLLSLCCGTATASSLWLGNKEEGLSHGWEVTQQTSTPDEALDDTRSHFSRRLSTAMGFVTVLATYKNGVQLVQGVSVAMGEVTSPTCDATAWECVQTKQCINTNNKSARRLLSNLVSETPLPGTPLARYISTAAIAFDLAVAAQGAACSTTKRLKDPTFGNNESVRRRSLLAVQGSPDYELVLTFQVNGTAVCTQAGINAVVQSFNNGGFDVCDGYSFNNKGHVHPRPQLKPVQRYRLLAGVPTIGVSCDDFITRRPLGTGHRKSRGAYRFCTGKATQQLFPKTRVICVEAGVYGTAKRLQISLWAFKTLRVEEANNNLNTLVAALNSGAFKECLVEQLGPNQYPPGPVNYKALDIPKPSTRPKP